MTQKQLQIALFIATFTILAGFIAVEMTMYI
jgi:hypothetical protein